MVEQQVLGMAQQMEDALDDELHRHWLRLATAPITGKDQIESN